MDQRMSDGFVSSDADGASSLAPYCFWGRRGRIGVNADRTHHGEGEHDQRRVTTPAMPGARPTVIGAEFFLRHFETVFDRPQRCPSIFASLSMVVPRGAHVVKKAMSPSAILRRIRRPRVHS